MDLELDRCIAVKPSEEQSICSAGALSGGRSCLHPIHPDVVAVRESVASVAHGGGPGNSSFTAVSGDLLDSDAFRSWCPETPAPGIGRYFWASNGDRTSFELAAVLELGVDAGVRSVTASGDITPDTAVEVVVS